MSCAPRPNNETSPSRLLYFWQLKLKKTHSCSRIFFYIYDVHFVSIAETAICHSLKMFDLIHIVPVTLFALFVFLLLCFNCQLYLGGSPLLPSNGKRGCGRRLQISYHKILKKPTTCGNYLPQICNN